MRIAVLGTGMVGRALANRFAGLGHDVIVATRDVGATLARREASEMGTPPFSQWQQAHPDIRLLPLSEAGAHAEIFVNATSGASGLSALEAVGTKNLVGSIVLDLALPLDFSQGMPPILTIANDDSLGERIQRAFPDARVVKTLNTMFAEVMVDPGRIPGKHSIFVAGEDRDAKDVVTSLLAEFGWPEEAVIDLGGIRAARATEMYMQLYFALVGAMGGSFDFNIAVVRA